MGMYLNIGNAGFSSVRKGFYVDKSGLIAFVNNTLGTKDKLTCVSRPRRFGKSFATQMLCAYYDKSCCMWSRCTTSDWMSPAAPLPNTGRCPSTRMCASSPTPWTPWTNRLWSSTGCWAGLVWARCRWKSWSFLPMSTAVPG